MADATIPRLPVVVLISGRGSNLQSIMDAVERDSLPVEIRAVISNRPDAKGLQRAILAGIQTKAIDHTGYDSREAFDRVLMAAIDSFEPALVILAGFMRILTPGFVRHYHGRLLNIHPSLLPEFPGLNTHARAIEAGRSEHGASVHFVTEKTDGGPVVAQVCIPVHENDDAATLAARVLAGEHCLYPLVIRWFAEGRISLQDDRLLFDGEPLQTPHRFTPDELPAA
jgi:phosphoribosylglycinamide formyltransferase-1